MNNKLLTLLGFAAKSRNLSYGLKAATFSASMGKAKILLVCNDISEKSIKEVRFHAEKHKVKMMELKTIDTFTLTNAVGRRCGVLSVNDSSFADAIMNLGGNV